MVGARNEQPAFMTSTQASTARIWVGAYFCLTVPAGTGRTEEPFFEGDPVHNPRAVLALDAATGAAVRAHEIARQGFRIDEADMAARACDADQHGVAPKK